jgi:hypothetical protein
LEHALGDRIEHGTGDGVALLLAVDGDGGDMVGDAVKDVVLGGGCCFSHRSSLQ